MLQEIVYNVSACCLILFPSHFAPFFLSVGYSEVCPLLRERERKKNMVRDGGSEKRCAPANLVRGHWIKATSHKAENKTN